MTPLRIVHMAATAKGAPWMIAIMREQRRRGHDVSAVIRGRDGSIAPILEREGIPYEILDLDLPSSMSLLQGARKIIRVARFLRRLRADVVHYHLFASIVMGRIASWIADAPLRFSMIPGTFYLEAPILGDLEARTAWADTRVIATCEKTRTLYIERGIPASKLELVYYGLDQTQFDPTRTSGESVRRDLGLGDDTPVVGMVAYFYPPLRNVYVTPPYLVGRGVKGHEYLFRAIPRILQEVPGAKFVLVGKGWGTEGAEYEQSLRNMVAELGIGDAVIFTGERNDVPETLASFDVALQCSLCENLGGSIEALMMGRPLIVTRVGGLVDSVKHEETGLLVPPADPDALAEAIVRLLKDRELAARLGANGRRWMLERFTLTRAVDDLQEIYERCAVPGPRYRLSRMLLRIPQLPFRMARLLLIGELTRMEKLTRQRLMNRLNNLVRRVLRKLRMSTA